MAALSEEQVEHYWREGYVVAPRLVSPPAVEAVLRAAADREVGESGRWQARIFEHDEPEEAAGVHRLLVEPSVTAAVRDIFNAPPRVFYGMLAVVPARGGNGLPWHQDNQYSLVLGGALNVFIALCDITPDKANLWVAPRSHRWGVQPSKSNETTAPGHREAAVEPDNGIPLPTLRAGDVCIFDRNTYHRSLTNDTDEHRYAYAAQFGNENARQAETGKKDPRWMLASDLRERWQRAGLLRE
jgi:ectoine hydroxylase-related dioxygenase (phytanoyl-CoA dioxygenase family)